MPGRKQKARAAARKQKKALLQQQPDRQPRKQKKALLQQQPDRQPPTDYRLQPEPGWWKPSDVSFIEFQLTAPWIWDGSRGRFIQVHKHSLSSETPHYWRCATIKVLAGISLQCEGTTLSASKEFGGLCQICTKM